MRWRGPSATTRPSSRSPEHEPHTSVARLALFRVVSDFREAMWGVLQQGVSTLDFDVREYAAEHFDRLLANVATPRFEHALSEVAGA